MFTGIIEELGTIEKIKNYQGIRCFVIKTKEVCKDTLVGDSIAVNGVCLTVTKIDNQVLSFEVVAETLETTNLKQAKLKDKVNLERSLKLNDRLSGHLVSGHIDCVGVIRKKTVRSGTTIFEIALPEEFSKNIVAKGSVAIDGISLTVAKVQGNVFSVNIIPHTLESTTLGKRVCSDKVNLELDMVGKYVQQLHNG
ncbi:riboflavin synthase [Candidatus Omnitrophota bacterium]